MSNQASGLVMLQLLGVLFVALRLCGVIELSWWWVLSPFWFPVLLIAVLMVLCTAFLVIHERIER